MADGSPEPNITWSVVSSHSFIDFFFFFLGGGGGHTKLVNLGVCTNSLLRHMIFCCRYKDGYEVLTAPSTPKSHRVILPTGSLFFLRVMQNKKEDVS